MLVKEMAKEKKEQPKTEKKVKAPEVHKEKKPSFFPKPLIVFSLLLIVVAVVDYIDFYKIPRLAIDIIILFAGLWMLKMGVAGGFYKKRKEIFKKYI
jgi:hypothetical protein